MRRSDLKRKVIDIVSKPRYAGFIQKLKQGATVISYHGVESDIHDPRIQGLHVPKEIFERQIAYLDKHFEIISVDELFDQLKNESSPRKSSKQVVISFDDGYENVLRCASPILSHYGAPYVVFVNTAYTNPGANLPTSFLRLAVYYSECEKIRLSSIGLEYNIGSDREKSSSLKAIARLLKHSSLEIVEGIVDDLKGGFSEKRLIALDELFFSERLLNWDEIKALSNAGATIGSHCHQHTILSEHQSDDVIDAELRTSKEAIESHVGECKYFAYPNGTNEYISRYAVAAVQKAGYKLGFSVEAGEITPHSNQYVLPRVWAGPSLEQTVFAMTTTFRNNRRYAGWAETMAG